MFNKLSVLSLLYINIQNKTKEKKSPCVDSDSTDALTAAVFPTTVSGTIFPASTIADSTAAVSTVAASTDSALTAADITTAATTATTQ